MKVEIQCYSRDESTGEHHWRRVLTWMLDKNDRAVCDNANGQESAEYHGVIGRGRIYYPADGKEFLRHLPIEYGNCSYARAVIVEE